MHRLASDNATACTFSPDGTEFATVNNNGSWMTGTFNSANIYKLSDTKKEPNKTINNPATALAISLMNLVEDKKQVTFDHPIFRRLISNKVRKSLTQ